MTACAMEPVMFGSKRRASSNQPQIARYFALRTSSLFLTNFYRLDS